MPADAYVDPFDRICHGLGGRAAATTDPNEVSEDSSKSVQMAGGTRQDA